MWDSNPPIGCFTKLENCVCNFSRLQCILTNTGKLKEKLRKMLYFLNGCNIVLTLWYRPNLKL